MKIALKIAGSILATISLVFFCMKYIPDWVESYIEMIEWGGIIAFFGMLFLLTFVLFAIMYILLEIGIWVKGQGARNASLVLLLIASFFRISNVLSDLLDVSRVRSMISVAFESGFVFFIVFDIYIVIAIILLASKRRCGVGSIITTSIFIVLYASLYAVFGSSMLEEALLIDVCLFVSQLLVNIAVTPRPVSYQNNVPNYGPVNVIPPTGYPGPIPGNRVQSTGYPGPIPGNGVQPTGYPGPIPGNRVQPTGYPGPIPGNGVQPTGYPGPIPGNGVQPTGYPGPIPGNRVQPTGYPGPIPGNGVQPTGYPGPKPGQGMTPVGVNVPGRAGTDTQNMLNNKPFDPGSMIPSDINDDLD